MSGEEAIRHRVIGAVHVLTISCLDPQQTARALAEERSRCSSRRVVIDLSELEGSPEDHLDEIRSYAWSPTFMVRLRGDERPALLTELNRASRSPAVPSQ